MGECFNEGEGGGGGVSLPALFGPGAAVDRRFLKQVFDNVHGNISLDPVQLLTWLRSVFIGLFLLGGFLLFCYRGVLADWTSGVCSGGDRCIICRYSKWMQIFPCSDIKFEQTYMGYCCSKGSLITKWPFVENSCMQRSLSVQLVDLRDLTVSLWVVSPTTSRMHK